jgi:signal transduction histidine kinase
MTVEDPPSPRAKWRPFVSLLSGGAVTAVLLAGAAVLRVPPGALPAASPGRLLAVLVGTALLLGGLLVVRRAPRLSWAFFAMAATLALLEAVAAVRSYEEVATGVAWRDLTLLAGLALVGGVGVVVGYADANRWDTSRLARTVVLLVLLGAMATAAAAGWAVALAAQPEPPALPPGELTPLRFAARLGLLTIVGAFALGLARDLLPAATRAGARLASEPAGPSGDRLWRYLGHLADELAPGRTAQRQRAAEAERARLAADLHAHVLPDLRRAAALAESSDAPDDIRTGVRRALEDVERLLQGRQSIVLEEFGLVAALEWLAERTEQSTGLRVELELEGSRVDSRAAVRPDVERAAFRIALLALDNVVRHARASSATVRLNVGPALVELSVADDGAFAGEPSPGGGRGLRDMRREADSTAGALLITPPPAASVTVRWDRLAAG